MFQSARLKLTLWYVVVSMVISILFSVAIFQIVDFEINRSLRMTERRIRVGIMADPYFRERIISAEEQIKINLVRVNLFILSISALAGYFLSGRVLRPIKSILDEQNRFIADASHELRTPLTAIQTGIEVNLRDKKMNIKQAKDVLKSNLDDISRLKKLSNNLLILAHVGQNSPNYSYRRLNLSEVLKKAVDKMINLALKKKITIETKFCDCQIRGDEDKLVELIVILLDNAIKYSKENGVIRISSKKSVGKRVHIDIQDQGAGIEENDLPHIFDRFFRGDKSRSQTEGYGLGLSIAKQIIEAHKGRIDVLSSKDKGTIFTISLPAK